MIITKFFKMNWIKNKDKLKLFATSGLNQMISSGTNFLINLYLISVFSPNSFGIYGIGFAIVLFIGGLGNSFFLTQMVVIYPLKNQDKRDDFVINVLNLIIVFCGILFLLIIPISLLNNFILVDYLFSKTLIPAIIFASVMYLLKEFFVRTAYNDRKEFIAIYIHSSILITVVLLYVLARVLIKELDISIAFTIYGVSHLAGVFVGAYLLKIKPVFTLRKELIIVLKELWVDGKWATITNVVYMLRSQTHIIIALLIIGTVAVGNMNAARLFITPAVMIIPVISQLALPRLSKLREINKLDMFKKGRWLTVVYLSFGLVYSSVLLSSYEIVISNFVNESYGDLFVLTLLWCIYAIILAIRNSQDIIAQVLRKFKKLTVINFLSAIITLIASYFLAKTFGLNGVLIGMIIGELFLILMLFFILKKENINSYLC